MTFSCSEPQLVAATFQSSSSSFLSLPAPAPVLEGPSVRLQFRTWNPDGLLLSSSLISGQEPSYLILQISSGRLRLTHQTATLKMSEVSAGEELIFCPNNLILIYTLAKNAVFSTQHQIKRGVNSSGNPSFKGKVHLKITFLSSFTF